MLALNARVNHTGIALARGEWQEVLDDLDRLEVECRESGDSAFSQAVMVTGELRSLTFKPA